MNFNMDDETTKALVNAAKEDPMMAVELVKQVIDLYKPAVYGILHEFLGVYKDYANNTEFPETKARVFKNAYDAYMNVGFTADQAMALLINDNLRLMEAAKTSSKSKKKTENN